LLNLQIAVILFWLIWVYSIFILKEKLALQMWVQFHLQIGYIFFCKNVSCGTSSHINTCSLWAYVQGGCLAFVVMRSVSCMTICLPPKPSMGAYFHETSQVWTFGDAFSKLFKIVSIICRCLTRMIYICFFLIKVIGDFKKPTLNLHGW
jgi:hypothetical protein